MIYFIPVETVLHTFAFLSWGQMLSVIAWKPNESLEGACNRFCGIVCRRTNVEACSTIDFSCSRFLGSAFINVMGDEMTRKAIV